MRVCEYGVFIALQGDNKNLPVNAKVGAVPSLYIFVLA